MDMADSPSEKDAIRAEPAKPLEDDLCGIRTFTNSDSDRIKRRPAHCVDCGCRDTTFVFLYRFRFYRQWRRKVKIRCNACGKMWKTYYP